MSADLVAHCIANLPRHIPDAFERMMERAQQTPGAQFLSRNAAAIDRIRAERLAEEGRNHG